MYKYILLFCALLCACISVVAQTLPNDIIITLEREQLHVKVLKVGINEVEYLKADNLEGPLHVMAKKDIISIRYANGAMDVFNETANDALPKPTPAAAETPAAAATPTDNLPDDTVTGEAQAGAKPEAGVAEAAEAQAGEPAASEVPMTKILPAPKSPQARALPLSMTCNGYDFFLDGKIIPRQQARDMICSSSYQGLYYWKRARRNAGWGWTLVGLGAFDLCMSSIAFSAGNNGTWALVEGMAFIAGASVCLLRVKPSRQMAAQCYNEAMQEKHKASIELAPASQGIGLALRF